MTVIVPSPLILGLTVTEKRAASSDAENFELFAKSTVELDLISKRGTEYTMLKEIRLGATSKRVTNSRNVAIAFAGPLAMKVLAAASTAMTTSGAMAKIVPAGVFVSPDAAIRASMWSAETC